ncbi:MAG: cytochrome c biogenesis protein CcsA [Sandaracinaceae bacterium]|nr:cytochrome c biogenesis protein CcsA [Sandaracinaceae bacterium]
MNGFATALFALIAVLYSLSGALYLAFLARGTESLGKNATYVLTGAAVAHVVFLVLDFAREAVVFGDIHQALAVGSLLVAVAYLGTVWLGGSRISATSKLQVLGAFVTPITLLFFLGAGFRRGVEVSDEVRSVMLPVHIGVNVLGIAAFALAFGVSIAYVVQERQLRQKKLGGLFQRLPSLDTLDKLGFRMVIVGFPLLTLGVVTGTLWAVRLDPDAPPIGPTQTMGLVEWALFAAVLLLRAVAGWRGRRAALGTMLGFLVACAVLFGYVLRG